MGTNLSRTMATDATVTDEVTKKPALIQNGLLAKALILKTFVTENRESLPLRHAVWTAEKSSCVSPETREKLPQFFHFLLSNRTGESVLRHFAGNLIPRFSPAGARAVQFQPRHQANANAITNRVLWEKQPRHSHPETSQGGVREVAVAWVTPQPTIGRVTCKNTRCIELTSKLFILRVHDVLTRDNLHL